LVEFFLQIIWKNISRNSGSKQQERRFDCVQRVFDRYQSQARGFLLAGDLNEQNFIEEWKNKVSFIFAINTPIDLFKNPSSSVASI
jgi:hypothetical protein